MPSEENTNEKMFASTVTTNYRTFFKHIKMLYLIPVRIGIIGNEYLIKRLSLFTFIYSALINLSLTK